MVAVSYVNTGSAMVFVSNLNAASRNLTISMGANLGPPACPTVMGDASEGTTNITQPARVCLVAQTRLAFVDNWTMLDNIMKYRSRLVLGETNRETTTTGCRRPPPSPMQLAIPPTTAVTRTRPTVSTACYPQTLPRSRPFSTAGRGTYCSQPHRPLRL